MMGGGGVKECGEIGRRKPWRLCGGCVYVSAVPLSEEESGQHDGGFTLRLAAAPLAGFVSF